MERGAQHTIVCAADQRDELVVSVNSGQDDKGIFLRITEHRAGRPRKTAEPVAAGMLLNEATAQVLFKLLGVWLHTR